MRFFSFMAILLSLWSCNYTPSDPERDLRAQLLQTVSSFDSERFKGYRIAPMERIPEIGYATPDSSVFWIKGFSDAQNSREIHFTRGEDPTGKMRDVIFNDIKVLEEGGLMGIDGRNECLCLYVKQRINGKRWIIGKCEGGKTNPLFNYFGNQNKSLKKLDSVWYFFPTVSYTEYKSFP